MGVLYEFAGDEDQPIVTSVGVAKIQGEPVLAILTTKGSSVIRQRFERIDPTTAKKEASARLTNILDRELE